MVDDSHAVGFVGERGRGTPEFCGVEGRVDILTGTLGKALGGASGGYTAGRQGDRRAAAAALAAVPVLEHARALHRGGVARGARAAAQATRARRCAGACARTASASARAMTALGFDLVPGAASDHPGDAGRRGARDAHGRRAARRGHLRDRLFVSRWCRKGKARIRTQMSAAHTDAQIDRAVAAFAKVGRALGAIR